MCWKQAFVAGLVKLRVPKKTRDLFRSFTIGTFLSEAVAVKSQETDCTPFNSFRWKGMQLLNRMAGLLGSHMNNVPFVLLHSGRSTFLIE
jgi:hypothetical protein